MKPNEQIMWLSLAVIAGLPALAAALHYLTKL